MRCILFSEMSSLSVLVLGELGVSEGRLSPNLRFSSRRHAGARPGGDGTALLVPCAGLKCNCIQGFVSLISGEITVLPPTRFAKGYSAELHCLQSLVLCSALTYRSWNCYPLL